MFDSATVRKLLQRGIDHGWWSLEHLDHPSDGYCRLEAELRRHSIVELRQMSLKPYVNLLRDPSPPVRVEASPSPRDFAPAVDPEFDF
ncbi:MAG: hypothetical protein EBY40_05560 [Marivivens sp.]|nr:hypothetical protein [Marivivens sp.]NBT50616.1 hypothetical protein [Marivivens sp.]NCW68396.1 hypothetical protein [Marivivens sp.]NDH02582.1 hypothetical protein [Marivivens sp.]